MNNLTKLYKQIKDFAENHNMIKEFILLSSEDEINQRELNYRSMILMPLEANLSRELNNPSYSLDFGIIIVDRTFRNDSLSRILSVEENLMVVGQLQDYLLQLGEDVNFQEVELTSAEKEDYNVTVALCDFSATLARNIYQKDIDFNE